MRERVKNEWTVGFRDFSGKYVVRNYGLGVELAPVFDANETALEIARHVTMRHEFFDRIPCVAVGTVIPRPKDAEHYVVALDGSCVEKRTPHA